MTKNSAFHRATPLTLAVIACTALAGCATTTNGASDEAQLLQVARTWQDRLADERFRRALRLVSSDFSSRAWPDKDALSDYFDVARERGFFLNSAVDEREQAVTIENGQARIYPVGIRGNLGTAVFELSLRKEKSNWKITSLVMELY
ncbi:MAG: hypothetical protein QGD90_12135 [Candidatus Hydrogenedentes bacterium]|nr:hypothetical protein [Candidatus Hydrogenedentota bacterium]